MRELYTSQANVHKNLASVKLEIASPSHTHQRWKHTMAAVYKSISKHKPNGHTKDDEDGQPKHRNRQRVLILSSRGITYRYCNRNS